MKKLILMMFALILSSAMIFSQEQTPVKKQTKQQTKEQVKTQGQTQSGDPIMIQERTRTNEGKGTMNRNEKKEMKKQNHGQEVSGTAKQNRDGVQKHDRDQVHKQAKPMNHNGARPPMHQGATPPAGSMQRGGKR